MHTSARALAGALFVCAGLAGAGAAQAQAMPPDDEEEVELPPFLWEVTPFVGYRMGGDFDLSGATTDEAEPDDKGSFGFAINLAIDDVSQYELFYSRQEASFASDSPVAPFDLDVEYLHLGGTLIVNDELPLAPYIVGGLGATRFSPQTGSGNDDTRFSMSLGAGVKLPVSPRFAVRLEARGYLTLINSDSAFFCASGPQGGVCAVSASGDSFVQFELLAGAVFAF